MNPFVFCSSATVHLLGKDFLGKHHTGISYCWKGDIILKFCNAVDPWTTLVCTAWAHIYAEFFLNKHCRSDSELVDSDCKVFLNFLAVQKFTVPSHYVVQGSTVAIKVTNQVHQMTFRHLLFPLSLSIVELILETLIIWLYWFSHHPSYGQNLQLILTKFSVLLISVEVDLSKSLPRANHYPISEEELQDLKPVIDYKAQYLQ